MRARDDYGAHERVKVVVVCRTGGKMKEGDHAKSAMKRSPQLPSGGGQWPPTLSLGKVGCERWDRSGPGRG